MLTEESIAHIKGIVAEHGSDAWWEMETADLLPPVRDGTVLLYVRCYDKSSSSAWSCHSVEGVGMFLGGRDCLVVWLRLRFACSWTTHERAASTCVLVS